MTPVQTPTQALTAKLRRRDHVTDREAAALDALLDPPCRHTAGSVIIRPGERPSRSTLLVTGWVARFSVLEDGARSFTQLGIAGDFVDLHSLLMKQMDHGVVALTDCVTASAPHAKLIELSETHAHLTRLLWLDTVIDGAIHREWLHRMGTQNALGRTAHILCEMEARLESVSLAGPDGFEFPLTQNELADCLGLSAVHANRTLMELRRLGLVSWRAGWVRFLDRDGLARLAEFDPTYLRLHCAAV
jgi:CRP-like cAMP-binding protein